MLTLHVLTFIDFLQHRVFCFKCAIYILFNSSITSLIKFMSWFMVHASVIIIHDCIPCTVRIHGQ